MIIFTCLVNLPVCSGSLISMCLCHPVQAPTPSEGGAFPGHRMIVFSSWVLASTVHHKPTGGRMSRPREKQRSGTRVQNSVPWASPRCQGRSQLAFVHRNGCGYARRWLKITDQNWVPGWILEDWAGIIWIFPSGYNLSNKGWQRNSNWTWSKQSQQWVID